MKSKYIPDGHQWKYICHPHARLVGCVLLTRNGFLKVHNKSTKRLARLKHSITIREMQAAGINLRGYQPKG